MARTNKRGGNTAGMKGSPFKGIFSGIGKAIGGAAKSGMLGGVGLLGAKVFGGGGGGDPAAAAAQAQSGVRNPLAGGLGGVAGMPMKPGMGGMGAGAPMMKKSQLSMEQQKEEYSPFDKSPLKQTGFTPYKEPTPFKTDATLVSGAYDAASGMGTVKYGQIAQSRAFGDMVDTVEDTVNKSSKAQYQKDRRRSKRKTRSDERYADWRERFARREDVKEKIQSGKRKVVDVVTGGTDYDYDPNKTDVQEGQYGAFWKRKNKK